MKNKLTIFLAGLFLLLGTAGSANALPWSWDLTGTGYEAIGGQVTDGGMTVNFTNDLGAASSIGTSTLIEQGVGVDGILNNGDVFTELGFLNVLDADNTGILFRNTTTGNFVNAYFAFDGLSGTVTNYDNGADGLDTTLANYSSTAGNALSDDSWDLAFTPGVGTMTIYLDDDLDPTNGAVELATLSLLAGEGSSPEFVLGQGEGRFGLIAGFQTVRDDFWSFTDGTDFNEWLTTYGANSIMLTSFNLGATFRGVSDDGINLDFEVLNEGSFQVSAVPEPTTMLLFGVGLLGLAGISRKKKIA